MRRPCRRCGTRQRARRLARRWCLRERKRDSRSHSRGGLPWGASRLAGPIDGPKETLLLALQVEPPLPAARAGNTGMAAQLHSGSLPDFRPRASFWSAHADCNSPFRDESGPSVSRHPQSCHAARASCGQVVSGRWLSTVSIPGFRYGREVGTLLQCACCLRSGITQAELRRQAVSHRCPVDNSCIGGCEQAKDVTPGVVTHETDASWAPHESALAARGSHVVCHLAAISLASGDPAPAPGTRKPHVVPIWP
jgi:hypothetical protein